MQIPVLKKLLHFEIFDVNDFFVIYIKFDIRRILIFYLELTNVHALTDRKLSELVFQDHVLGQPSDRIFFILLHHEALLE